MTKNTNIRLTAELLENKKSFLMFCFFVASMMNTVNIIAKDEGDLNEETIIEHRKIGGPYQQVSHIPGPAAPHTSVSGASGGGTGRTTLTQYSVLLGEGTSPVNFAVPGNTGIPLVSTGAASDPAFGTALVLGGGTGLTSATAYAVLTGGTNSTAPFQSVASTGATGSVLTSTGSASLPTFQTWTTNVQVFTTTGAGVYTPTSGMKYVVVEAIAGGGGSGGGAGTTLFASAGGGSGSYSRKVLTAAQVGTTMAYVVGTGGTAGASGGGAGAAGVATTFGGTWVTTNPGSGSATASAATLAGGAGGALGTGGIVAGFAGYGTVANGGGTYPASPSGAGGNTILGQGGYPVMMNGTGATPGTSGQGYGSGAGGGTAGIATPAVFLGGTGAQGAIVVTEYILA
ncbi:hypothetical protein KBB68_02835 [Candidatus Babeliales bacterium]|nr:hypothetical protein [Candidatus Babeliales bacterium]